MELLTQVCPICLKSLQPYPRHPNIVCGDCADRVSSKEERKLRFYNTDFWSGFGAEYSDNKEKYLSHYCYIDGIRCYGEEAYFGGIVIQKIVNYRKDLYEGYWKYSELKFQNEPELFDRPIKTNDRPPVFYPDKSLRNIIIYLEASRMETILKRPPPSLT